MKVIIAGSRTAKAVNLDEVIRKSKFKITEVVSGGARGIDTLGEEWAKKNGVSIKKFVPNWNSIDRPDAVIRTNIHGKYNAKAGIDRNEEMGNYADAAIVCWDGESKGSKQMADYMESLEKPLFVEMI